MNETILDNIDDEEPIPEAPFAYLVEMGFYEECSAKVIVKWSKSMSKNKQILILKKLFPNLRLMSSLEIYRIAQPYNEEWEFAQMAYGEAKDLAKKAKEWNVNIEVIKI